MPATISLAEAGEYLRAQSDLNGCERTECVIRVDDFPVDQHPPVDKQEEEVAQEGEGKKKEDDGDSMRAARAMCRPLVEYIYEKTGYSFVYKDCRSGRRLKYAHSLRYLCAQRQDQDFSKRRSTEKKKFEEEMYQSSQQAAMLGMTLGALPENEEDEVVDINATTSAAIAAFLQERNLAQGGGDVSFGQMAGTLEGGAGGEDESEEVRERRRAENEETMAVAKAATAAFASINGVIDDQQLPQLPLAPEDEQEQHPEHEHEHEHELEHLHEQSQEQESNHSFDIDVNAVASTSSHSFVLDPFLTGPHSASSQVGSYNSNDGESDSDLKPTKVKGRGKGW
ncbi:hypothetical protein P7C70_g2352, partial [Phenoliferia sp. Uapishka_3]